MAGDIWKTYDASTQGGAGFSKADFDYLRSQNWMNSDIYKAAARSGNIDAEANQLLTGLSQSIGASSLPTAVRQSLKRYIEGDEKSNRVEYTYQFLGGDRDDASNYRINHKTSAPTPKKSRGFLGGFTTQDALQKYGKDMQSYLSRGDLTEPFDSTQGATHWTMDWNKKIEEKHGAQVYSWNGINADGSANALGGYEMKDTGKRNHPSDPTTIHKRTNFTWRLPSEASTTPPPTPPPADPPPRFNLSDYISGSSSSGNSATDDLLMGERFVANTRANAYEDWLVSRPRTPTTTPSTYTPRTLTTSGGSDSGGSTAPGEGWRRFWEPPGTSQAVVDRTTGHSSADPGDSRGNMAQASFRELADTFRSRYRRPHTGGSIPSTQSGTNP